MGHNPESLYQKLICLVGEISRQDNIQVMEWLMLIAFTQVYSENSKQEDIKSAA